MAWISSGSSTRRRRMSGFTGLGIVIREVEFGSGVIVINWSGFAAIRIAIPKVERFSSNSEFLPSS